MKRLLISLLIILMPAIASADALDDAKAAGHVIELPTGYLEAANGAPRSADKLVADINKRRRAAYTRIAKKNKIAVDQVARESYVLRYGGGKKPKQ